MKIYSKVNISTNPTTARCSGITSKSCSVTGLSYSTTYYWKVTASDGNASNQSQVWSFTTQANNSQPIITGTISITSSPSGASVFLDETYKGKASPTLTLTVKGQENY